MKLRVKSQKGITMLSLTVYVFGVIVLIGVLAVINNYVNGNLKRVRDAGKYAEEYTAFEMYFLQDIKEEGISVVSCDEYTLVLSNGAVYQYGGDSITRNDAKIVKNLSQAKFSYTPGMKEIVTVTLQTKDSTALPVTVEYVLRYW